ncbi:serine/threonine-protein phosphatase 7 long form homolog isoform X3 [Carex rostrata]
MAQDTPSGAGDTAAASTQGDFHHIQGPRKPGQTNVKNKRLHNKALSRKIHQKRMEAGSSSQPTLTPDEVINTYNDDVSSLLHQHDDDRTISDILWMPLVQHKIDAASKFSTEGTTVRHNWKHVPYDQRIGPALRRLGLYQLSQMTNIIIDAGLISGLIERWRPETHTFHLPVGEMTVTLQDVSCLWGLPITGEPLTGVEYGEYGSLIGELLGLTPDDGVQKKRKFGDAYRVSQYAISLPQLRRRFAGLGEAATDEEIDRYTRAYILDMLACWMFPDSSGDTVPLVYLHLLRDLEHPRRVNWGAAVLALLYRGLCMAAQSKYKTFIGPCALLQHWSWSRLSIARPRPRLNGWTPAWGVPDFESCPAFGAMWCSKHTYVSTPHGATMGVTFFRSQIECLTDDLVDWQPYEATFQQLPSICRTEREYWMARVPLIHFSVVEHYYPDRVMRQFGLYQQFPPPMDPISQDEWSRLHTRHGATRGKDWSIVHSTYIAYTMEPQRWMVPATGPYDPRSTRYYRMWFQDNCAFTVFLHGAIGDGLADSIPVARDEYGTHGYIPSGPPLARITLRSIKNVAFSIKLVLTRGWKKFGKIMLCRTAPILVDAGYETQLHNMLHRAGLPDNLSDISSCDSAPIASTPLPAQRWMTQHIHQQPLMRQLALSMLT